MEPTDNFSQKKKKDLVAIATLFGILTEEKANRMTKPELIEFLAEQDRISREAAKQNPVRVKTRERIEETTDDALLRATDLLIATIENSNIKEQKLPGAPAKKSAQIPSGPVSKPAAKTSAKAPAVTPAKTPAVTPGKAAAATVKKAAKVSEKVLPAVSENKVSENAVSEATVSEAAMPETVVVQETASTHYPENTKEVTLAAEEETPAAISGPALIEIVPNLPVPVIEAEPALKKRRGRPKKASEETQSDMQSPVSEDKAAIPVVSSDTGRQDEMITEDEISAQEEIITREQISAQMEIGFQDEADLQAIKVGRNYEYRVPALVPTDESIVEFADEPSDGTSEKWNQQPASTHKSAAPKGKTEQAPTAPHIVRTKRHSVIIKPKDEEFSKDDEQADTEVQPADMRSGSILAHGSHEAHGSREPHSNREPHASREPHGSHAAQRSADGQDSDAGQQDLLDKKNISTDAAASSAPAGEHSEFGAHHARTLRPKEQQQEMLSGVLELMSEGYGFLRRENYLQGQNDIYVPAQYVRRFGLRVGDFVIGPCRPKRESDRYQALQYIKEVNGMAPEKMLRRVHFDRLTPIYPDEKYILETDKTELSTRIIDLVAPIGKGQRGMIVSPPKAGKTILLQKIANAISINNPDSKLIVLLIDERPEEVTDMQRSINGEVVYSTFDKTPENHVRIVELVLERAERLVELGQDVVILLDSMTRLARAYNLTINPTGRTLSGGLDPGALYGPKRFFGAARNVEGGGSLTIVATSLVDTGSRMDEVIFEEFKGTGNMEVCLDRKLSEKRIFPAIDINKSGTRHEELLMTPVELDAIWTIRKAFGQLDTAAVTEMIISLLLKTSTNNQFIQSINISFNDKATFDAMRGTRPAGNSTNSGNGK